MSTPEPDITEQKFDDWTRSLGAPVTTEQAVTAVLRMIDSRLIDTRREGEQTWKTLERVKKVYASLSRGEQYLYDIARTIWKADTNTGASMALLGGLDRTNRRKVLMVLMVFYLGGDLPHIARMVAEDQKA